MCSKVKIIIGAIEIFRDKGIKFTMDDLAYNLGISKRTLYQTISSKEELLYVISDYLFDSINEKEQLLLKNNDLDPLNKLRQLLVIPPKVFIDLGYTRIFEIKKFYPEVFDKIIVKLQNSWDCTEELFNKSIENKLIERVNLNLIKNIIVGTIRNLFDGDYLYKENLDYENELNNVINIIFNGIIIK